MSIKETPMPTNFRAFLGDRRMRTIDVRAYELLYPLVEREALYNNLRAAEWALGFVPNIHSTFLSTGIGTSCVDVVCDKIVPSSMKIGGTDPQIETVNKEFKDSLTKRIRLLIRQSAMYGASLGRICFGGDNFQKPFIDSVPLGRFRVQVDESGRVIESTCFLETKKINASDYSRFILIDKRYFDKNGKPKAYYGVIKQTFNALMVNSLTGTTQNFEFDKKTISKQDLEMLQQIYPNYELYKETELPFEGYLGVELFNWTESNDKFPSVWFGEAFLTNSIDLLYAYDHAYTCKENDKYLGRGRAIVPAQFNPQDGIGLNRSVQTQIQRGQTLGSMTNAFNQSKMRPPLDNTFYDEIYFNGEVSKPEKIQFDLRSDQWRIELDGTLGDIASRLHISAVDLDARVNGATQRTATEINKDSDITITTASTKQIQFTNGLNELIKAYLEVKGLDTSNIDSFIEWPPSGIANPQVATTVFTTQVMNGLLSKYTAIHKLNPEWTDEEVKEELERIDSESAFTPDFAQDKDVI